MGRRKLFNGPLFLILTLITLLFLASFVVGQKEPAKNPKEASAKGKETPTPSAASTPTPATPPMDPKLANECNACWIDKRKKLPSCKGLTDEDFNNFNKQPSSSKVASCLCEFANHIEKILNDTCSAVCVDQTFITNMINSAEQYKSTYKCNSDNGSILGPPSNLVVGGNSANANSIKGNNMYLELSFVMGLVSLLIFS
jgi:hypothetical protein